MARPSPPSFGASAANAVLQDLAKSVRNGTEPSSKLSEFLKDRPSTVNVFWQSTGAVRGDRAPVQQAQRADHLERGTRGHLGVEGQIFPGARGRSPQRAPRRR